jgi:hypothetical protein
MLAWENDKRVQYRVWRRPEGVLIGPPGCIVKEYINELHQFCTSAPIADILDAAEVDRLETLLGKRHRTKEGYAKDLAELRFFIEPHEVEAADKWMAEHIKTCPRWKPSPNPKHGGRPYHGAIGGATHWEFVDTTIGTLINFCCTCGARTLVNGDTL